jgi:hypothetical protein
MLMTPKYLVVDVALFGSACQRMTLTPAFFSLRINGSKQPTPAQQPFAVAYVMEAPPDDRSPELTLGRGDTAVIIGPNSGRRPANPADRRIPDTQRYPRPRPTDIPREPPLTPRQIIERAALPSGDVLLPASGVVFFAYPGKTESIRSLELIYEGPAGTIALPLR